MVKRSDNDGWSIEPWKPVFVTRPKGIGMNLTLLRHPSGQHCTLGALMNDGETVCFTLEDVVREIPGEPVSSWKVKGETAIPEGRYKVIVTYSNRFDKPLPLLVDVPGFEGVRIHPGNTDKDTEGCILVGTQIMGESIVESRKAFAEVFGMIQAALQGNGEVWLTVGHE